MKKIKIIFYLIVICVCLNINDCFASTKVNVRTEGNYYVPSDVLVTESNKNAILTTPSIDAKEKIYDFAEILTDSEEKKLYNQVMQFIKGTNIDFIIVTSKEYSKTSMKDYAHDFYTYNDFGKNGVLLFIDMKVRGVYMVVEGSAYSIFTDSRMNPLLEASYNNMVNGSYYKACSNFIKSSGQFVDIGIADGDESIKINDDGSIKVSKDLKIFEVAMFALVGTIVVIGVMILSNKMAHRATSSKVFLNNDTIRIINISEMYLGSKTMKKSLSDSSKSDKYNGPSDNNSGGAGLKF